MGTFLKTLVSCCLLMALGTSGWVFAAGEDPKTAAVHAEADRYFREGLWDRAIDLHRELLRTDSDNASAHYHLGYAYGQQERHQEEIKEYRKAVQLGLEDADLFFNLGMVLMETRGSTAEALEAFRAAVRRDRSKEEYFVGLGLAYFSRGEDEAAVEAFRQGIVLNPAHVEAHLSLGLAYAGLRRYGEARAEWQKVLELDPGNVPARINLRRLQSLQGREKGPAGG